MESINVTRKTAVKVFIDPEGHDPREWDNLGTMACWHGHYQLGDEQPTIPPQEYESALPDGVTLPLYLFDHSGITMRTDPTTFQMMDSAGWDWGQVGFIHCSLERARAETGYGHLNDEELREKVAMMLIGEVEVYDAFLRGAVYGFEVVEQLIDEEGSVLKEEHIDSCGGFHDTESYSALEGMYEHVDEKLHALLVEAFDNPEYLY